MLGFKSESFFGVLLVIMEAYTVGMMLAMPGLGLGFASHQLRR